MRLIKDYKGCYPEGAMVTFTINGANHWRPALAYYYIKDISVKGNGTFDYSVSGCTRDGRRRDGHGMAWVDHEELQLVED